MSFTLKEVLDAVSSSDRGLSHSLVVGQQYLVQTVTHYYTGRLASVTDSDLVLESAAWIPDTGRFSDSLKNGTVSECEPIPGPAIISRAAIICCLQWSGRLPSEQK